MGVLGSRNPSSVRPVVLHPSFLYGPISPKIGDTAVGGHGLLDFLMQLGRERESLPSPLTRKPLGERGTHLFLRGPVIMAGVSALGCTPPQVRAHSCGSAARCGEGCRADEPTVSTWLPLGISGKVWTLWSERCTQMQMFARRSQSLSDSPPPPG